jgi:hypothetical protein
MGRIAIMLFLGLLSLLPSCHSIKDDFHKRSLPISSFRGDLPRLELESLLRSPKGSASSEIQTLQKISESGISPDGSFLTPFDQEAIVLRLAVLHSRLGLTKKSASELWKLRQSTSDPWTRSLAQALQAWCLLEGGRIHKAQFVLSKIPDLEKARLEPLISQMTRRVKLSIGSSPLSPQKVKQPNFSILPRSSWGNRKAIPRKMELMGNPTRITIHHTAMDAPQTPKEATHQIRLIQRNQIQKNRWGDIGYHFLIDPWGRVFEGRKLKYQGAHAGDGETNKHNLGICLLGNFQSGEAGASHPTQAQLKSMRALVQVLTDTFHISPSQVFSHQQIRPTATSCPGTWLLPEVRRLKKDLAVHQSLLGRKKHPLSHPKLGG